eukprot:TRINITY_DN24534_c0_g1_i1.p1 TRINITY_DN24534_c0_g1~~TRINITY_DN24534_c0_g1_i1.p1  ORF type:complete len:1126 (+),score=252.94 TRINITY_DN24534_c0_g1_i1:50-3379(+)
MLLAVAVVAAQRAAYTTLTSGTCPLDFANAAPGATAQQLADECIRAVRDAGIPTPHTQATIEDSSASLCMDPQGCAGCSCPNCPQGKCGMELAPPGCYVWVTGNSAVYYNVGRSFNVPCSSEYVCLCTDATLPPVAPPTQAPATSPPIAAPSGSPMPAPTRAPARPTSSPTAAPTTLPPTAAPVSPPTAGPMRPSASPSRSPVTGAPTAAPAAPTTQPSAAPVTAAPSAGPNRPSGTPSGAPLSSAPTQMPVTAAPTSRPPTSAPSAGPQGIPTLAPTAAPSTLIPSLRPTASPTVGPSYGQPTGAPVAWTAAPTVAPSATPTGAGCAGASSALKDPPEATSAEFADSGVLVRLPPGVRWRHRSESCFEAKTDRPELSRGAAWAQQHAGFASVVGDSEVRFGAVAGYRADLTERISVRVLPCATTCATTFTSTIRVRAASIHGSLPGAVDAAAGVAVAASVAGVGSLDAGRLSVLLLAECPPVGSGLPVALAPVTWEPLDSPRLGTALVCPGIAAAALAFHYILVFALRNLHPGSIEDELMVQSFSVQRGTKRKSLYGYGASDDRKAAARLRFPAASIIVFLLLYHGTVFSAAGLLGEGGLKSVVGALVLLASVVVPSVLHHRMGRYVRSCAKFAEDRQNGKVAQCLLGNGEWTSVQYGFIHRWSPVFRAFLPGKANWWLVQVYVSFVLSFAAGVTLPESLEWCAGRRLVQAASLAAFLVLWRKSKPYNRPHVAICDVLLHVAQLVVLLIQTVGFFRPEIAEGLSQTVLALTYLMMAVIVTRTLTTAASYVLRKQSGRVGRIKDQLRQEQLRAEPNFELKKRRGSGVSAQQDDRASSPSSELEVMLINTYTSITIDSPPSVDKVTSDESSTAERRSRPRRATSRPARRSRAPPQDGPATPARAASHSRSPRRDVNVQFTDFRLSPPPSPFSGKPLDLRTPCTADLDACTSSGNSPRGSPRSRCSTVTTQDEVASRGSSAQRVRTPMGRAAREWVPAPATSAATPAGRGRRAGSVMDAREPRVLSPRGKHRSVTTVSAPRQRPVAHSHTWSGEAAPLSPKTPGPGAEVGVALPLDRQDSWTLERSGTQPHLPGKRQSVNVQPRSRSITPK